MYGVTIIIIIIIELGISQKIFKIQHAMQSFTSHCLFSEFFMNLSVFHSRTFYSLPLSANTQGWGREYYFSTSKKCVRLVILYVREQPFNDMAIICCYLV